MILEKGFGFPCAHALQGLGWRARASVTAANSQASGVAPPSPSCHAYDNVRLVYALFYSMVFYSNALLQPQISHHAASSISHPCTQQCTRRYVVATAAVHVSRTSGSFLGSYVCGCSLFVRWSCVRRRDGLRRSISLHRSCGRLARAASSRAATRYHWVCFAVLAFIVTAF